MSDFSSAKYWEDRYNNASDVRKSGAGSYGKLAKFKAKTINKFVKKNQIKSIVEFGCGDGNQLSLAKYPSYIGLDVSKKAIEFCETALVDDDTKKFLWLDPSNPKQELPKAELAMSLDVIFHLVEDEVFENYMKQLFGSSTKYVCIYSSNSEDIKGTTHVKHRKFTNWIKDNLGTDWELLKMIPNKYPYDVSNPNNTSFADFYFYFKKGKHEK